MLLLEELASNGDCWFLLNTTTSFQSALPRGLMQFEGPKGLKVVPKRPKHDFPDPALKSPKLSVSVPFEETPLPSEVALTTELQEKPTL